MDRNPEFASALGIVDEINTHIGEMYATPMPKGRPHTDEPNGPTIAEVLQTMLGDGRHRSKDIAERFNYSPRATCKALTVLAKKGLAARAVEGRNAYWTVAQVAVGLDTRTLASCWGGMGYTEGTYLKRKSHGIREQSHSDRQPGR